LRTQELNVTISLLITHAIKQKSTDYTPVLFHYLLN